MSSDTPDGPFLTCPSCGVEWLTRSHLLRDSAVVLTGYQPHFRALEMGFLYFTHQSCHTTMMLPVVRFADLDDGPVFSMPLTGSEACRGHCKRWRDLQSCDRECECAWVRRVMGKIRHFLSESV